MTRPRWREPRAVLLAAVAWWSQRLGGARALQGMPAEAEPKERTIEAGPASWYGPGFHGRSTASGEPFNTNELTSAHRTLPFGTRVKVVHQKTRRSVVVRINDRGPYTPGRVIDLSWASAQAIGLSGVAQVALLEM